MGAYDKSNRITSSTLDNLKPGSVLFAWNGGNFDIPNNARHVAIYLYREGNTVHWIDQDGYHTGFWDNTKSWIDGNYNSDYFTHYKNP